MQDELAFMSRGVAIGLTMIQRLCLSGLKIHVSAVRFRRQPYFGSPNLWILCRDSLACDVVPTTKLTFRGPLPKPNSLANRKCVAPVSSLPLLVFSFFILSLWFW